MAELLPDAEVVACSVRTGEGVADVAAALDRVAAGLPGRAEAGDPAPVLHVDRAFTIRGAGTVVTGTLWSGSVGARRRAAGLGRRRCGPAGARPRRCRCTTRPVERAAAGQRVAVNLVGVEVREVARGDVLAGADAGLEPALRARRRARARGRRARRARAGPPRDARGARRGSRSSAAGSGSCASSSRCSPAAATTSSCGRSRRPTRWAAAWSSTRRRASTARRATPSPGWPASRAASRTSPRGQTPVISRPQSRDKDVRPAAEQASPLPPEALALEERLRAAGHEPPLEAELGEDAAHLPALRAAGRAERIGRSLWAHPDALADVAERVRAIAARDGEVTLAVLRDELGTSRKFAQALLEHLDVAKVTLRRPDDTRVLRRTRT